MDFSIADDDRLLQSSVKDFVENSANAVWREIEKKNELPQALIDEAKDLGLLGLSIPEQYGGVGFSVVQKALVHEMLGRGPWGLGT
jgi:acyl-CoA dehydrogenase